MDYQLHIGIDYSGAQTADTRLAGLQVYCDIDGRVGCIASPSSRQGLKRNWTRREIAAWISELVSAEQAFLLGIDHGLSFPIEYFQRYGLRSWDEFLKDFAESWPAHQAGLRVDDLRERNRQPGGRFGSAQALRLAERWTSSAKSVFQFDVQGSVAKSTHAGLPWIWQLRQQCGGRLHYWPFDGWMPPAGQSVIAEVFPSILRNRYSRDGRTVDQQDAYSIARWLRETDRAGWLARYFQIPLPEADRRTAELEGWILGIA